MNGLFKNKRALLLDFDGTIGDTFTLHEEAFKTALSAYDLPFVYRHYIGQSTGEVFERFFEKAGKAVGKEEIAALTKAKRQAANDLYAVHLKYIAGAEAFVKKAHGLGYLLMVGSSGSKRNILRGIELLGLSPLISDVVTADDVTYSKPHPEIFLRLLERNSLSAAEALVLEDAPSGLEAAIAAGIEVVCIDEAIDRSPYTANPLVHFAGFPELEHALTAPFKGIA